MLDRSILRGVKELGEFRLMSQGTIWAIFVLYGTAYIFSGNMPKRKGESNKALYERVKEELK